ncbi:MAG: type II secretion system GspH family protein [Muribaculaceae bacterium]|nr:type II secretion system GspH family protein [Muribaculaceae bacterium]
MTTPLRKIRHCEERSDEAIQVKLVQVFTGLPRRAIALLAMTIFTPVTLNLFQGLSMLIHPVRGKRLQREKFKILKKILKRVQDDIKGVSSNDKFFAQINNRHCEECGARRGNPAFNNRVGVETPTYMTQDDHKLIPAPCGRGSKGEGVNFEHLDNVPLEIPQAKAAFTLAEVLITLGIIGVVAAMTIPTIIANTHKRQYSTAFKKSISTLSNAARMAEAQYGFDFGGINDYCNENSGSDHPESKQTACAILNGTLKGVTYYYGLDKLAGYEIESHFVDDLWSFKSYKDALPIYQLADGSLLVLSHSIGGRECGTRDSVIENEDGSRVGSGCYGFIDVNGTSLPNKEVTCSNQPSYLHQKSAGNCVVDSKSMGDIFPVTFYNNTVEPNTSAAWYVYRNSK